MSTKASIAAGERYHLYHQVYLGSEPESVFLEINQPTEFSVAKETMAERMIDSLSVEIPAEDMDAIAIAWVKKRGLQGVVGGPAGNELGSPDNLSE
ncbi:hypothetical protein [Salicola sp. Rm-C-2C1-2]|jgi:hypothetical protein|uniref:hypothetical protein n=1 Tax=Salicola sp. Rm-C-2C1-2 TaxID=3141321 RepID=UPI0032E3B06C